MLVVCYVKKVSNQQEFVNTVQIVALFKEPVAADKFEESGYCVTPVNPKK